VSVNFVYISMSAYMFDYNYMFDYKGCMPVRAILYIYKFPRVIFLYMDIDIVLVTNIFLSVVRL
jgi:hypothetical protein